MTGHHDQLTLILMGDETEPVRRFHVGRSRIRNLAIAAGGALALVVLAAVGLAIDYARLRIERPEVNALRTQAALQEGELVRLQERLARLDASFAELHELERKVRIIADLPPHERNEDVDEDVPGAPAEDAGDQPGGMGGYEESPAGDEIGRLTQRLEPTRESLEDLVERLEAKRERLASMPSIQPTKEGWITSAFGMRTSPFTGRRHFHKGLDIAADYGTEIIAPARGRVVFSGRKGALGRTVILDHGYGTRTTFGHSKELYVKKGDLVERGMVIAAVGNSGRSTGPHLHYTVSVQGKAVDPQDFILE